MKYVWISVAVVAALVAWSAASAPGRPVQAAKAARTEMVEFIEERGQTRLPKVHLVTMPYEGRVAEITLQEGADVKSGQVAAQIVQSDLANRLSEAESSVKRLQASLEENNDERIEQSSLQQAFKFVESMQRSVEAAGEQVKAGEAKREFAKETYQMMQNLFERKARTEEEMRSARLSYVEAQVEYQQDLLLQRAMEAMLYATNLTPTIVKQYIEKKALSGAVLEQEQAEAKARLAQAKLNVERSILKSPVDGVVLMRHETNERVLAAGTVLLELGDLRKLQVEADVLSQDVVRVRPGAKVEIFGPAIGPHPVLGTVARIYPAGFTKVSSLGVEEQRVKVIVDFAPEALAKLLEAKQVGVGFRVQVKIFTARAENAVAVPRSALFRSPAGKWQAFVVRDGRARLAFLEVGLMNDEKAEILKGIAEGDLVVLSPESTLSDGAKVSASFPEATEAPAP